MVDLDMGTYAAFVWPAWAVTVGVLVAGIVGALVAVPLAAAVNAVGLHLAAYTDPGDDPVEELEEDYVETGGAPEAPDPDGPTEPGGSGGSGGQS